MDRARTGSGDQPERAPMSPRRQGSPLRVLIVGPLPPPLGGMAVQGQLLARKLAEHGVAVRLVATNPTGSVFSRVRYLRAVVQQATFLGSLITGIARSDVVHILGASWFYFFGRVVPSIIVARGLGRRVLVNYRGGEADAFLTRHGRTAIFFLGRVDAVTVPSPFLARVFARRKLPTVEVPNIADLERFPFRVRESLRPRMLVNRTLAPIYNVALAIDAFARIQRTRPDATLTVAGTGPLEPSLREHAARLGLQGITFCGAVDNTTMASLYATHDIYLNPTNVDNMPISVLECLAAGVAVVSTNVGGVPDLLTNDEDCLLVPPNDPDAMATAVLSLLGDAALSSRLIAAGARKVRRFSWDVVWPRLRRVYVP